jgi:predicted DNA-binding protein (MmcQ/YjbR family)
MNVDFVRDHCLSFPNAKESLQWGETLCFKVGGKIFATLSLDEIPPHLSLKTTGERFAELTEIEGIVPARYVGRYKWITLERLNVLSAREIRELIQNSYDMVIQKTPAKKQSVKVRRRGDKSLPENAKDRKERKAQRKRNGSPRNSLS